MAADRVSLLEDKRLSTRKWHKQSSTGKVYPAQISATESWWWLKGWLGLTHKDLGQNKRKYGYGHLLCQASWGKLITQKNRMTETEHGTCSPDMAAQQHTEIKGF